MATKSIDPKTCELERAKQQAAFWLCQVAELIEDRNRDYTLALMLADKVTPENPDADMTAAHLAVILEERLERMSTLYHLQESLQKFSGVVSHG